MADTTTATPEAPAAPDTATTQTLEAPAAPKSDTPAVHDLDSITDFDALGAILDAANDGTPKDEFAPEPQTPPPAAPAAPKATDAPAAPKQPVVEDEDTETEAPKNVRFHAEDPTKRRYLRLLKQNPDANPIELARLAGYKEDATAGNPAPAAPETPPAPPVPKADPLKPYAEKVAELKQKLKDAEANYAPTAEILDELQDAKLALRDAKEQIEQETYEQGEYERDYQGYRAQAVKLCPEAAKPGTPQADEIQREVAFLKSTNPNFFASPDYPVKLIEIVTKRRPDIFKLAPAAPAAPATPPAAGARLAKGAVESPTPGGNSAATLTPELAAAEIDKMTPEQLEALSNETGERYRR